MTQVTLLLIMLSLTGVLTVLHALLRATVVLFTERPGVEKRSRALAYMLRAAFISGALAGMMSWLGSDGLVTHGTVVSAAALFALVACLPIGYYGWLHVSMNRARKLQQMRDKADR